MLILNSLFLNALLDSCLKFKQKESEKMFTKQTNETGKVFIVTGANAGIGKETVLEIAKRGGTIYMACRNMEKCEKARQEIFDLTNNSNLFSRELDLSSLESIRKFALGTGQAACLINNAGVFQTSRCLTKDGFEMQLGVNHMGHFLLTHLLLDVLKKSAPSRIVNVASMAHMQGTIKIDDLNSEKSYSGIGAYSQSKLANILFTRELARRLEGTGVAVNSLHPGTIKTEILRNLSAPMKFLLKPVIWTFFKTPKSGAQTTLYAALDPDLKGVSGMYFSDCKPKDVASAAKDDKTAKFLWEESEKWTGLRE